MHIRVKVVGLGYAHHTPLFQAIVASKCYHVAHPDVAPINHREAFFLATLGGSQGWQEMLLLLLPCVFRSHAHVLSCPSPVLNLDDKIGNFTPGKDFDALIVDLDVQGRWGLFQGVGIYRQFC